MKKYLVIGNPIAHSLSPKLHNYWLKINKISAFYEKKELDENDLGGLIEDVKNNKITELKVHGLFIAIGHDPATSLFKDQLKMDKEGYLITKPDSTETNIPGVFAAGDVQDFTYRQAITSAASGCMAALDAQNFLEHAKKN